MAIRKNDIPILEFDDDVNSVLTPGHDKLGIKLPEKAIFAFLIDEIDKYCINNNARVVTFFESATKNYPIYVVTYKGEEICLAQAPVGSAPSVQLMEFLIAYGVRKIITAGSCGGLVEFEENTFIVPKRALRDEGASYHYQPPYRFIDINEDALKAIEKTLNEKGIPYREVTTWTTDGFFRETKEKVKYRIEEGCEVVEMECSALAACAKFRNIMFGQILFTADTLANVNDYDKRGWGKDSLDDALYLCLDCILNF